MRVLKQLLLCLGLAIAGLALWAYLVPGAGQSMVKWGVPARLVAIIHPAESKPASAAEGRQQAGNSSGGRNGGGAPGGGQGGAQGGGAARATLVSAQPVKTGTVNDRLSAIGSGEAIHSVVVMPQASGTISQIMVSAGQKVRKGQVLARLDDAEQIIDRDKARVSLKSAEEKSASYKNLQSFSRLDVFNAQIAEEAAKLALATSELNFKRRDIVAPIDGIAGIVSVNIGDNVNTQTSVVTLDDRSAILVDFWAPERFAVAVEPGQPVEVSSVARPGQVFTGRIEAVDNRIDPASRTMRIRARVENDKDALRAGMAFSVSMRFAGEKYPSVNPLAVQWDGEGSFVWQIRDNKSFKVRIRVVQRNPDAVLIEAALKDGDVVATEGLQRMREGGAVRLAGSNETSEVAAR